jgi:hypothetical protein
MAHRRRDNRALLELSGETPGGSRAAAGKDPLGDDGLTPFFDPSKNTFFDLPF